MPIPAREPEIPRHTLALAALLLLSVTAAAQGSWSDRMDRPGLVGRVFALGEFQGQVVAGGLALSADGLYPGNLALFDGARWRQLGGGIRGSEVRDFAELQGDLVAGGEFVETVSGGATAWNVARFDGTDWHALGGNELSPVFALEVFRGELYAAGGFGVRRWTGSQWSAVGGAFDGPCRALFVGADDRLYVGGEFALAGGVTASKVAAWNGATWSALGAGLGGASNATVWDFAWYQGELWAGGSFDVPGGQSHEKVGVFDGTSWRAVGSFPDSSIPTFVYALEVFGGQLYAGGSIIGTSGVPGDRLVRWNGSVWSNPGGVFNGSPYPVVFALHAIGGQLYVGGEFSRLVSYLAGVGIVSKNVGAFDGTTWSNVGEGLGLDSDPETAVLWRGDLVVGGGFAEAGTEVANGPMAFDGASWRSLGSASGGSVEALLSHQDQLYASGTFTAIGGQPIRGVARYDGTSWHPVGPDTTGGASLAVYHGEVYVGGLGGVRRFDGTSWRELQPQLFGFVLDMHVHNDVLYIGGSLSSVQHLVAWNGVRLSAVGGGMNAAVNALESLGGDLIAGGEFTQAGGVGANRLARWDGSSWSPFGGLTGTVVYDLVHFQGDLVASGNLFVPGLPPEKYLARWDGSAWHAFGAGFANGAALTTLVPDEPAGALWGAGIVAQVEALPSWYLARWETTPPFTGTGFCAGDGTGSACPCGNSGSVGHGCENSFATGGAFVAATGNASIASDTVVLHGSALPPTAPALFFQGTDVVAAGAGAVFGDGLRCAGGTVVRLGTVIGSGGAAQYPQAGDVPVSVRGGVSAPGVRTYQVWYRNAAPFCLTATFNLSNGWLVQWSP